MEALRQLVDGSIGQIVTAGLSTVTITATLLYLDWPLGVAALAVIVPPYATMRSFRHRASVHTRRSEALAAVTTKTAETFAGIRAVQTLRLQRANDAAFAELNGRHEHPNGTAGLEMARIVANIAVAALMSWGAYRVAAGAVELGIFAAGPTSRKRRSPSAPTASSPTCRTATTPASPAAAVACRPGNGN